MRPISSWFQWGPKRSDAPGKAAPEAAEERTRRRNLLRRFWRRRACSGPARRRSTAWLLSAGLLAIIVLLLGAAYAMNVWNRAMFDGLQNRDAAAVGWLSVVYFVILGVSVALSVRQVYARMTLQRRWRAWLANQLVDRWIANGRYYQLNLVRGDHANPEYRIADDVRIATESPVDFVSGITQAFLSAATFIVVLWTIGGALELNIGGLQLADPGLPGHRRAGLRADRQRLDGADRQPVRAGLREQEPGGSRVPLRHHPPARERREHRADPRRGGGARRRRPLAQEGARRLARDRHSRT